MAFGSTPFHHFLVEGRFCESSTAILSATLSHNFNKEIKMAPSVKSFVLAFIALCSVALGAKYTYEETASTCTGVGADKCGPEYWSNIAGYEACANVDLVSTQTPVDFSNVQADDSIATPEFEIEEGGCEVRFFRMRSLDLL